MADEIGRREERSDADLEPRAEEFDKTSQWLQRGGNSDEPDTNATEWEVAREGERIVVRKVVPEPDWRDIASRLAAVILEFRKYLSNTMEYHSRCGGDLLSDENGQNSQKTKHQIGFDRALGDRTKLDGPDGGNYLLARSAMDNQDA